MAYKVVRPLVYVKGNKVIHHIRTGGTVDIPASQAEQLLAEGRLEDTNLGKRSKAELVDRLAAKGADPEVAEELPKRELLKKLKGDAD